MTLWKTPRINTNFNNNAKKLGGTWTGEGWQVSSDFDVKMQKIHDKYFGGEKVPLKITAKERIAEYYGPVLFAGFVVTRAFGRDSGAKLGSGVALISGDHDSGGSIKNWKTIVEENSTFVISDFPKALIDKIKTDKWDYEIFSGEDDDEDEIEEF